MSDQPAAAASASILRKKVAGIPVMYLAGGFVLILVAIAWKTKTAPSAPDAAPAASPDTPSSTILTEDAVPPVPVGTVVAAPPVAATALDNSSITTNDEWLKRGVAVGMKRGHSPGVMQDVLQKYLSGAEMSFWEGGIRDEVLKEIGLPPYPPQSGGTRGDYGRTQGPLPRTHVVKNAAEDSATELAALYYGSSQKSAPIVSANNGQANYKVGQSVKIPVYPVPKPPVAKPAVPAPAKSQGPLPRKHVVKSTTEDTATELAALYYGKGKSSAPIAKANGGRTNYPVGTSVNIPKA